MIKILYDCQIFDTQKYGGISRYFVELIQEFAKMNDIGLYKPAIMSNNHYLSTINIRNINPFCFNSEFKGKSRLTSLINKLYIRDKLRQKDFDVFHPTYYHPAFIKYLGAKPFVVTVYDMIHEKFSDEFVNSNDSNNKRYLAEKASKIIAISENTKTDLINIFNINPNKIEVVYLGNSLVLPQNNIELKNIPERYILFVGRRSKYKNFNNFVKAVTPLIHKDKEFAVVCIGGGMFSKEEHQLFNKLNIQEKLHQINIDDDTLPLYYKNALMFVFPSLYEGFGIPILEAFACNCPLVCSNTSSLPEIAGNAALYFDPADLESIQSVVNDLLNNDSLRKTLVQNGKERLKQFSWEITAQKTSQVYKSVL